MRNERVILLLVMLLVASAGCTSKKQAIRGGEGQAGAGITGGQGGVAGQAGGAGGEGVISSETVKGEKGTTPAGKAGISGGTGSQGSGGAGTGSSVEERQAGIGATQEKASPFQDIHYDFDQSSIRDDARPILAGIAAYMAKTPSGQLIVEGHCDSRGTAEYNMALGERRAEAAKKYLAALGVKSGSLVTVSYGKEKPFTSGETEEAWAKNRRGHFLVR